MKDFKNLMFIIAVLGSVSIFSCNENASGGTFEFEKGENYYPLEVGNYITYQVDSIIYLVESSDDCIFYQDTSSHYLKEEIIDTYEDNAGDENFVVERYLSDNINGPWTVIDVWNTKITDTQVEKIEENLRFIKMVFPVTDGATWNGNTYFENTQDTTISVGGQSIDFYRYWSSNYEYDMIDISEEINGIQFDSVMTVIQSEPNDNKIYYRYSIEKYARGVGMIFKEMLILDTQCCGAPPQQGLGFCDGIPWEEKAERGLILRQSIVDYN